MLEYSRPYHAIIAEWRRLQKMVETSIPGSPEYAAAWLEMTEKFNFNRVARRDGSAMWVVGKKRSTPESVG